MLFPMTQQEDHKPQKGRLKISNVKDIYFPIVGIILTVIGIWLNYEANERQRQEATHARKQKYLEYFLDNYSDSSSLKQAAAFALLKYVDDQVRKDLVYSLSANTSLSKDAWVEIVKLKDVKLNFGAANNYRVEIYYSKEHKNEAMQIKYQLDSVGYMGQVVLGEKIAAFWDNYGWGNGNEIRYEPSQDSIAIIYFFRFIDSKNPALNFRQVAVDDTSRPNSIAIHLPPKRNL